MPSLSKRTFWTQREQTLEQSIGQTQQVVLRKKYFIRKMITDPDFRERVARENAGFIKPEDFIIFFKTPEEELQNKTGTP